jgi:hypothetical protein
MVIFGAGASHDSDPAHPSTGGVGTRALRLPLAGNLFWPGYGEFAARYPACQGLMRRLRAAAPDIEPELERIRAEAQRKTFMLRELDAIRYYIQSLIVVQERAWLDGLQDHITSYTHLLQEIEEWREEHGEEVALVTFNYDRLLDLACRSVVPELRLTRVLDYGHGASHFVFKLHGSTDWHEEVVFSSNPPPSPGVGGDDYANYLIDLSTSTHSSGRYVMDGEQMEGGPWGPLRPAIAIPMATKGGDDFACPQQHIDYLTQVIPEVSDLVLIGWRGQEQHFHYLWRTTVERQRKTRLRRMLVVDVSKEAADGITQRVREAMALSPGVTCEGVGDGFSAALRDGVFRRFLDAQGS